MLCEAVQEANSFYSLQLFVAILSSFLHLIVTFYNLFLRVQEDSKSPTSLIVMQLIWNFTQVSQLMALVLPSSSVTNAADKTAPIVCKLMNRDLSPEVKKELEAFLLQLLHHNARFSAMGFFPVQTHILTAIAGSVTTYLVILIQFKTKE
nr:gustatory receptor 3 [Matsumurasca onukii]